MKEDASPLDRYIPQPDVRERFETTIHAPADVVMGVARGIDMQSVPTVRAIFRLREWFMRASPPPRVPRGLLEETRALGWQLLEERPGRLVVCGAACQPWLPDVKFSPVAPERFAAFDEPLRVKIAWTLEAHPLSSDATRFVQETRAVATDEEARRLFRRYWRWARFGIVAIRLLLLPAVRRAAEAKRA